MKSLCGKAGEAGVVEQLQPRLLIPGDFDDVRERLFLCWQIRVANQLEFIEEISTVKRYCAHSWLPIGCKTKLLTTMLCLSNYCSQLDHTLNDRLRR